MIETEDNITPVHSSDPQAGHSLIKKDDVCSIGSDVIEFFDSLNWYPSNKDDYCKRSQSTTIQCTLNHSKSFICKDELMPNSYALKIINSDLFTYSENQINPPTSQGNANNELGDIIYVPGVENGVSPFYSEFSKLKQGEQSKLYLLFVKRLHTTLNKTEMESFQDLMAKANGDHQLFQRFVERQWITQHCRRCLQVPSSVIMFIDHLWKLRIKQSLKFYPSDYKINCKDIPLTLNDPFEANAEMEVLRLIKTKGGLQKLLRPYWHRPLNLVTDFHQLCKLKPDFNENNMDITTGIVKPILPSSLDPDVDSVILNENIDVVITSSGIKTIVENALTKFTKEWILPVIIKEVLKPDGKKKVVIIDKNLPPLSMSNYDKNMWYAKIASKWALISGYTSPNWLSNNESYLDGSLTVSHDKSSASKQDSDLEEGEIKNDDVKAEDSNVDQKSRSHRKVKSRLVYKLWDLHKSSTFAMSKQEQRNLKVLTRFRIDGRMTYMNYNKEFTDELCLSSRLEFQPEFGASIVESKDLIREYVDLFIRNNTKLCRVRSVGHTQEVMMTEVKTLQDIREKLLANGINPKTVFDPLYVVLTRLVDQPPGHYLLQHTARGGPFAQLLVQADNQRESTFKLSHTYSTMCTSDVNLPPRQIDPFTLTAIHQRDRTLPALFKPQPNVDNRKHLMKSKVSTVRVNHKKRGKKRSKLKAKKQVLDPSIKTQATKRESLLTQKP